MLDLENIKQEEDCIKKTTYEMSSHTYYTTVENVETKSNGYGLVKEVTFRGLRRYKSNEPYIDDDTTFTCTYGYTNKAFDNIPFGSEIEFVCKIKIETIIDSWDDVTETFKLTHPKHVHVTRPTNNDTFKPYIKQLPEIDVYSEVSVYEQYEQLGILYDNLCKIQQNHLDDLERWRLYNINKITESE